MSFEGQNGIVFTELPSVLSMDCHSTFWTEKYILSFFESLISSLSHCHLSGLPILFPISQRTDFYYSKQNRSISSLFPDY